MSAKRYTVADSFDIIGANVNRSTTRFRSPRQHLGDLRRLVRQYGRTQDQVFPTGTFFKNGNCGTDVNLPITTDELNNPSFTGCIDRNH